MPKEFCLFTSLCIGTTYLGNFFRCCRKIDKVDIDDIVSMTDGHDFVLQGAVLRAHIDGFSKTMVLINIRHRYIRSTLETTKIEKILQIHSHIHCTMQAI